MSAFLSTISKFLPKELSQNFALIPGAPHGTHIAFRFVLVTIMLVN
jgi:hypothetical protein